MITTHCKFYGMGSGAPLSAVGRCQNISHLDTNTSLCMLLNNSRDTSIELDACQKSSSPFTMADFTCSDTAVPQVSREWLYCCFSNRFLMFLVAL